MSYENEFMRAAAWMLMICVGRRAHPEAAWQVNLDIGTTTWAPVDEDDCIRKEVKEGIRATKKAKN